MDDQHPNPWPGLWALVIGFFMILVDATIVNVANPAIMSGLGLGTDYNAVIWVTSAYLLAYAVPMLVTGRLGDRFGPKRIYLIGLVVFTLASAWCGVAGMMPGGGIGMLIAARAVQGLGAALISPQSMAIITRTFAPDRRGAAMGVWGSVAGIANLVGPILGGLLVDAFGWESVFFVNVPIGVIGLVLAVRYVPRLPTHPHRFDLAGVALWTSGLFLLVFGIQEGETYRWGAIVGPVTVTGLIVTGLVLLAGFLTWQARNPAEPLFPLALLRDRNFTLANTAISALGFAVSGFSLPVIFYLQTVRGLSPTMSALLLAPAALISAALAPLVGRLIDRVNPRNVALLGICCFTGATLLYSRLLTTDLPIGWLLVPSALLGFGTSAVFGPISNTATRNLPPHRAGAGAGVYNTTRQVGAVVGSASISALIQARLAVNLPGLAEGGAGARTTLLPAALHEGFTKAMSESLLLPAAGALSALVVVAFFVSPVRSRRPS